MKKASTMRLVLPAVVASIGLAASLVAVGGHDDAAPALSRQSAASRSLLAIVGGPKPRLARVETATLRVSPGPSVRLGSGALGAVRSPSGRWLAVGGAEIRIINVEQMRLLGRVRSPHARGSLEPVGWLEPGRLLAIDWAKSSDLLARIHRWGWLGGVKSAR